MRQSGADATLVGACAVHVGIQFMLREFGAEQVASWIENEARALRDFGRNFPRTVLPS